jgi:hypothetical protein
MAARIGIVEEWQEKNEGLPMVWIVSRNAHARRGKRNSTADSGIGRQYAAR